MIIVILILLIILLVLIYFQYFQKPKENFSSDDKDKEEILLLKKKIKELTALKYADDNIFTYLKCHNQPTKNVCKTLKDGSSICRSRLINCDNFRLVLEDDALTRKRLQEVINL